MLLIVKHFCLNIQISLSSNNTCCILYDAQFEMVNDPVRRAFVSSRHHGVVTLLVEVKLLFRRSFLSFPQIPLQAVEVCGLV